MSASAFVLVDAVLPVSNHTISEYLRMTYWGRFYRTEMDPLLKRINTYLMRWARKKYKRLRGFKRLKAWWKGVTQRDPDLFVHWAWTRKFNLTGW